MALAEVYGGQRSLVFELTIAVLYLGVAFGIFR